MGLNVRTVTLIQTLSVHYPHLNLNHSPRLSPSGLKRTCLWVPDVLLEKTELLKTYVYDHNVSVTRSRLLYLYSIVKTHTLKLSDRSPLFLLARWNPPVSFSFGIKN